jgi:hypothetical protein
MFLKRLSILVGLAGLLALAGSITAQDTSASMMPVTFTVRIDNISGENTQVYSDIGIAGVPVGATQRRPTMPGEAIEFIVKAKAGDHLSFATMYGQSNDSFFGPDEAGIALFDDSGAPISGDVSDQVLVWDAGTEVNESLGTGPNQGPRQSGPDAGEVENGTVQPVGMTDEFPDSKDLMHVTLTPLMEGQIQVRIENVSANAPVPTPFSPLVYVVHTADQIGPFFTTGEADRGLGLERLAESGNAEILAAAVAGSAVMNVGASPGVFVIHNADMTAPLFTVGAADRGQGLEMQAEDGNPATLGESAAGMGFMQTGVFNTPLGADKPGALKPGQSYEFTFTAVPGDALSFTEMFGQSNDLFFAPGENGIALFNGAGKPVMGVFTGAVHLWDAGTEVNQEPFVGSDQAPRQATPNTGAAEGGVVQPIYAVTDGFTYPSVLSSLRITITNDAGMPMDMNMGMNMMSMDNMMMTPEPMMTAEPMMEMTATPGS